MKRFLSAIALLLLLCATSQAQTVYQGAPNQSVLYKGVVGADSGLFTKLVPALGVGKLAGQIRCKTDGTCYVWDGTSWKGLGSGSGQTYIIPGSGNVSVGGAGTQENPFIISVTPPDLSNYNTKGQDSIALAAAISSALDTNNATTGNDTLAAASAYNALPTTPNNNGPTAYVMNVGRQTRIRQDGTVRAVQFYVGDNSTLSSFQIIIARNNAGVWQQVGRSENIAPRLTANSMNYITLNSPIEGVAEGDYVGYGAVVTGGAVNLMCLNTSEGNSYFTLSDPPASFDWSAATPSASVTPIRCYMDAPMLVSISNSIMAGYPSNRTYIEVQDATDYDNSAPYLLKSLLGIAIQNVGWAGQQTHSMLARFENDVLNANPRFAMIEGGINDLNNYDIMGEEVYYHTAAQVIANLDSMYSMSQQRGVIPIAILLLPATTQTSTTAIKADSVNAHIQSVIASYGGFYIDMRQAMGVFRSGGPAGNFWDANPAYFNSDGVHFNHTGAALAAQIIADSIISHYSFSRTTGYVKFTDMNTALSGINLTKIGDSLTLAVGASQYKVAIPAPAGSAVSVPVDTTAPDSANVYINSLDRTLRYIISDTEYVVQVSSKIPLISAGPEAITFPTATDLTESPAGTWQATTMDAASGHTGLSDKKLAAGTDGLIYATFVSGSTDSNPFGFNTANSQTLWAGMEAGVIAANGDLYTVDNGTLSGAIYTMPNGSLYGIRRTGSTLTAEVFNGSTWVVKYTFTFSSAADLYIVTDLYGGANHVLVDPTGIGLQ